MIVIHERVKGFLCVTAHPEGCAKNVADQIRFFQSFLSQTPSSHPPYKRALIIGGSTGYGLATRIKLAFGMRAATLNLSLERAPRAGRTASPGWYNTAALEKEAAAKGIFARSIHADAFSHATREHTAHVIKKHLDQIDLLIYSVAAPKRTDPETGLTYQSVIKPIGKNIHTKTVHVIKRSLYDQDIPEASPEEILATVKVMGGEDWKLWVDALQKQKLLAHGFQTISYSYIGSAITADIYRHGTIGRAKINLEETATSLHQALSTHPTIQGAASISVNKALVTQASSAIPILPLYVALLYQTMKDKKIHENTHQQIQRLFSHIAERKAKNLPFHKTFRLDDLELREDIQQEITRRWDMINDANLLELSDINGYWEDFLRLFGFARPDIDYDQEVEELVPLDLL